MNGQRIIVAGLLSALLIAGLPATAASPPATSAFSDASYQQAQALYRAGKLKEAADLLQKGADAGDFRATAELIKMHRGDIDFPGRDLAKVVPLMEGLVELGHIQVTGSLAVLYQEGGVVPKDDEKFFYWLKRGAEGGHVGAYSLLGLAYERGTGVGQDMAKALEWQQRAVEAGDARGMFHLGLMYARGLGVAKDAKRALQLVERSASLGYEHAKKNLPAFRAEAQQAGAAAPAQR